MINSKRLRQLLSYDPKSGVFINRTDRHWSAKAGEAAGSLTKAGYIEIGLDGISYYAHRLAWLYVTGEWPANTIDHKDGNRANNAWRNLRDVTQDVNVQNLRGATAASSSGLLGAYRCGSRFKASITVDGRVRHIGYFETAQKAHEAYVAAKRQFHQGCTL